MHIPEHIVVQHILPKVQDSLSIDTRLAFSLTPRRLKVPLETQNLINKYIFSRNPTRRNDYGSTNDDIIIAHTCCKIFKEPGNLMHYGRYYKFIVKILFYDSYYVFKKWWVFRDPSEYMLAEKETHYSLHEGEFEHEYFEIS